jgi:hypothetical protein
MDPGGIKSHLTDPDPKLEVSDLSPYVTILAFTVFGTVIKVVLSEKCALKP